MTTITARAGILCSDSKVSSDEGPGDPGWNVSNSDTKIWRLPDGSVLGAAHNSEDCEMLYNWMRKEKRGPAPKFEHVEGLMIKPNGQMWTFEGALWIRVKQEYYAIGSGARFAMSAMDAGATAYRACQIGIKRDPWSGGKVQMLKTKETKMNIEVGQWLQDCDPRYSGRKVMVHTSITDFGAGLNSAYVIYFNGRHNFKIRADRIKSADYTGRKGWKLTQPDAT